MTKNEIVKYWIDSSEVDFHAMESLYDKGHYVWALFVAHLVIEKLLKAHYVRNLDNTPPLIHNLLRLAEQAHIDLSEEQKNYLLEITTFNIKTRYPDYKLKFHKKATKDFTLQHIIAIKGLLQCLLKKTKN